MAVNSALSTSWSASRTFGLPFIGKALLCSGIVTAAPACLNNEDSAAGGKTANRPNEALRISDCGFQRHALEIRNPQSAIRNFKPAPAKPHESL
jgi:hypothetical protein